MSVCLYVCLYVCMYPCTSPLLPSISRKKHCFSSVFAKMMSKNTEFFQIFGKRMQEAQASKKAGRGNRAWDPVLRPKTTFSGTSSNCRAVLGGGAGARIRRRVGGGLGGGVILYPLLGVRHAEQCRRILHWSCCSLSPVSFTRNLSLREVNKHHAP